MTLIFAHRGLHVHERENTVAAFGAAAAMGVDGVELDVRRTRDGALVVHHDARVDDLLISQCRRSELPGHVATLDEAMTALAGLRVNVEIKNVRDASEPTYDETGDFARQVVTYLHEAGGASSVMISCFDLATCAVVRAFDETIAVGWLLHWQLSVDDAVSTALDHRLNAIHPYFALLNAATLERAHAQRLLVNVWTVNSPLDLRAMMDLGVDGLITDDPATAQRLAREPSTDEGPRPMA